MCFLIVQTQAMTHDNKKMFKSIILGQYALFFSKVISITELYSSQRNCKLSAEIGPYLYLQRHHFLPAVHVVPYSLPTQASGSLRSMLIRCSTVKSASAPSVGSRACLSSFSYCTIMSTSRDMIATGMI